MKSIRSLLLILLIPVAAFAPVRRHCHPHRLAADANPSRIHRLAAGRSSRCSSRCAHTGSRRGLPPSSSPSSRSLLVGLHSGQGGTAHQRRCNASDPRTRIQPAAAGCLVVRLALGTCSPPPARWTVSHRLLRAALTSVELWWDAGGETPPRERFYAPDLTRRGANLRTCPPASPCSVVLRGADGI